MCMYMYICIYVYIYIYIYMYVRVLDLTREIMHSFIQAYMHTCNYANIPTNNLGYLFRQ